MQVGVLVADLGLVAPGAVAPGAVVGGEKSDGVNPAELSSASRGSAAAGVEHVLPQKNEKNDGGRNDTQGHGMAWLCCGHVVAMSWSCWERAGVVWSC